MNAMRVWNAKHRRGKNKHKNQSRTHSMERKTFETFAQHTTSIATADSYCSETSSWFMINIWCVRRRAYFYSFIRPKNSSIIISNASFRLTFRALFRNTHELHSNIRSLLNFRRIIHSFQFLFLFHRKCIWFALLISTEFIDFSHDFLQQKHEKGRKKFIQKCNVHSTAQ